MIESDWFVRLFIFLYILEYDYGTMKKNGKRQNGKETMPHSSERWRRATTNTWVWMKIINGTRGRKKSWEDNISTPVEFFNTMTGY